MSFPLLLYIGDVFCYCIYYPNVIRNGSYHTLQSNASNGPFYRPYCWIPDKVSVISNIPCFLEENPICTSMAQIILVGVREGRDAIKNEIGIEIEESPQSADIFNKLRMRRDQVPIRPMMEGKLE
jgi:hypothetical protein